MQLSFNLIKKHRPLLIGILVGVLLTRGIHILHHATFWHTRQAEPYVSQQVQEQVYAQYGTDRFKKAQHNHRDIPPVLHFIWVSKYLSAPEHLPKRVLKNIKSWEKLHPKDQIVLWTNAMVRRHFPKLVPLLSKIKTEAWIADILRYKIIAKYGGVYIDSDIIAFKNIDQLLKNTHGFTVCEAPRVPWLNTTLKTSSCTYVCNAVIAARPHQPTLNETAHMAIKNTQKQFDSIWFSQLFVNLGFIRYSLKRTGPVLWTKFAIKHHFPTLKAQTFFPCNWDHRAQCIAANYVNEPHVFATHTWAKSW